MGSVEPPTTLVPGLRESELTQSPLRVAEYIRKLIEQKRFGPGVRLPSERELAEQFGMSHTTVRRGLAALVREGVIERRVGMGSFVAEQRLSKPASVSTRMPTIAMAVPRFHLSSPTIGYRLQGVRQVLSQDDYGVEVIGFETDGVTDSFQSMLRDRGFAGLLYHGFINATFAQRLRDVKIPFVSLGINCPVEDVPHVMIDYDKLLHRVVHEAYRFGHRQLALVGWHNFPNAPVNTDGPNRIFAAYELACRRLMLLNCIERIVLLPSPSLPDPALVDARSLLKLDPLPTCFIVVDEIMAAALTRDAAARNLCLPDDFSIVALSDHTPYVWPVPLSAPQTTTDDQTRYRMATELLSDLIAGRTPAHMKQFYLPEVIFRASLAAARVPAEPGSVQV